MPFKKENYPTDWRQISLRVRERDGWACKWCGVKNGVWIVRWSDKDGEGYTEYSNAWKTDDGTWNAWHEDENGRICSETDTFDPEAGDGKPIKIVLTVAHHPDPDPMNCSDDNLVSLCQRCHNRLDMPMRQQHAKQTRARKRMNAITAAGQVVMPILLEGDTNDIDIRDYSGH